MVKYLLFVGCLLFFHITGWSQKKDSIVVLKNDSAAALSKSAAAPAKDTAYQKNSSRKKKNDPHKATIYSAILPGLGQVYNKKYWKVPIVYVALGIPAYTYFYNKSWYEKTQYALAVTINGSKGDSLNAVDPKLRPLVDAGATNSIINYRNEFRKDQDYSVLFFLLFWGLQIVDATVDAHLKDFNVNNDLSFHVRPNFLPGPNPTASVSLVFDIHKPRPKTLNLLN